jgi:hypothetical protein
VPSDKPNQPVGGPVALTRFWFEFDRASSTGAFITPCLGVTAFNVEDAKALIERRVFPEGLPRITKLIEDVDVSTLDPNHVLPLLTGAAFGIPAVAASAWSGKGGGQTRSSEKISRYR